MTQEAEVIERNGQRYVCIERRPRAFSVVFAGLVALLVLTLLTIVTFVIAFMAVNTAEPNVLLRSLVIVGPGATISVVLAYVVAKASYTWIRVRKAFFDGSSCAICGYDLTGNVTGRCPECGIRFAER